MFKHFSIDGQPSIGVSDKLVVIVDRGDDLEVEVFEVVAFSGSDGLNFPFIRSHFGDADEGFHLIAFPVDEEEGVPLALQLADGTDGAEVSGCVGVVSQGVLSGSDGEASIELSTVSGEMIIVAIGGSGFHPLVAKGIVATGVFDLEV